MLVAFLAIKLMISKGWALEFQFTTHVFSVLFAYYLLVFLSEYEEQFKELDNKIIGKVLTVISSSSLEIYMIQRWEIEKLQVISFPLNLIVIMLTVVLSGITIYYLSELLVVKIPNKWKRLKSS